MSIDTSFVILSFNSGKFLKGCFDSIISKSSAEDIEYEIITIDNGSKDNSRSIINSYRDIYPNNFKSIFLHNNMGTTYSRNLGLNKADGEYICIIDSDTEILDGSFKEVFEYLNKHENIGIIAPKLLLGDGSIQNSVKKFPTFLHKMIKIPRAVFKINTPNVDFYEDFPFESEMTVDSAISACWIFRKALLEEVGYLDENFFYSPEDLDYCMRVRMTGKSIVYYPNLKILHHTQQISHTLPFSRISIGHFMGLIYYYRKYGGWFSNKKISSRFKLI